MENKTEQKIKEAQALLAKMLDGKSKEEVDALAQVSSVLDSAITESNTQAKKYAEMKDDYIEVVKNTKFKKPSEDDIESSQSEKTFESILEEIKKERKH